MSGVDYSKWDKMVNEMSDSDDDDNQPEVTAFDEPQSVTFGGSGTSTSAIGGLDGANHDNSSRTHPNPYVSNDTVAPIDGSAGEAAATEVTNATPRCTMNNTQLAENGAAVRRHTDDGRSVLHYIWRQSREEVTVVVPVPSGTRAGDIEVSLRAKPETITEGVAEILRVSAVPRKDAGGKGVRAAAETGQERPALLPVLEGELRLQVNLESVEGGVDWELKDYPGTVVARDGLDKNHENATDAPDQGQHPGMDTSSGGEGDCREDRRGVEIILRKHCPIPNAVVWWRSLLKGEPEIDVSAIKGRAKNNHQSVWEEALGMFKDKVAARKAKGKIPVEID